MRVDPAQTDRLLLSPPLALVLTPAADQVKPSDLEIRRRTTILHQPAVSMMVIFCGRRRRAVQNAHQWSRVRPPMRMHGGSESSRAQRVQEAAAQVASGLAFLPGGSGSFDPEPGRWPSGRRFVPHWTSEPRAARHRSAVAITAVPDAAAVACREHRHSPTPTPPLADADAVSRRSPTPPTPSLAAAAAATVIAARTSQPVAARGPRPGLAGDGVLIESSARVIVRVSGPRSGLASRRAVSYHKIYEMSFATLPI